MKDVINIIVSKFIIYNQCGQDFKGSRPPNQNDGNEKNKRKYGSIT